MLSLPRWIEDNELLHHILSLFAFLIILKPVLVGLALATILPPFEIELFLLAALSKIGINPIAASILIYGSAIMILIFLAPRSLQKIWVRIKRWTN